MQTPSTSCVTLGLEPASYGDVIAIDVFSNLVTAALRRHLGKRSPELPTVEDAQPGRMTIIHIGRNEGYIEGKLGALMTAIQRGRERSARRISAGDKPGLATSPPGAPPPKAAGVPRAGPGGSSALVRPSFPAKRTDHDPRPA